jgi:hypothetical protein
MPPSRSTEAIAVYARLHNTPAAFHQNPAAAEALTHELTDVLRSGRVVRAL